MILKGEIPGGEVKDKVREWQERGGILTSDPKAIPSQKIDDEADGVYATKFADKVLYYNSNNKTIKKHIPFLQKSIEIGPNSIISVPWK